MRAHRKFLRHVAGAEHLDTVSLPVGQANAAQCVDVHSRAVFKNIERLDIHRDVNRAVPRVVETALRDAANERHLAAFETDTNGAARTSRLAFATTTGCFAVTAGFALAEPLAAMLGAGTGF